MFKAAIRVNKIKSVSQLRGSARHAARLDETAKARIRPDAMAGEALAWSKDEDDRDYLAAFKEHKLEFKAGERKGSPLCLQALCIVSPEWVKQAGDLHDRNNPANQQLFDQAKAWAESWAGEGAVFGARLDLDEEGGAVVDLMISPVRLSRNKPVISTQKALNEIKAATGERNEYAALQTSWADWCKQTLDPRIERGLRREITAREHLSPETYGAVMDKARESLRAPSGRVLEVLAKADMPEEEMDLLSDFLTVKRELHRHKVQGLNYKPPKGEIDDAHNLEITQTNHWRLIWAIRSGASKLMEAASSFGFGLEQIKKDDRYENGKEFFPKQEDRIRLSAIVAHCATFYAQTEAKVKELLSGHKLDPNEMWPQNAKAEIERHEINLSLRPLKASNASREDTKLKPHPRRPGLER